MATMASKTKRKLSNQTKNDEVSLQVMKDDLVLKSSSDEEDSSESEESVYSGLEEEEEDEDGSSTENNSELSFEEDNSTSGEDEEESSEEEQEDDEDSVDESGDAATDSEEAMSVDSDEEDKKLSKKSAKLLKHHKRKSKGDLDSRRQSKTNQSDGNEISKKETGKLPKDTTGTRKSKKTGSSARSDNAEGQGEVKVNAPDEYQYDSSDEEDIRNTVGNIPMEWYKEYDHIGYSLMGAKILKPKTGDELDEFLNKMDNPDYWRTVKDKSTGQNVVLSQKDVEFIQRMRKGKYTDPNFQEFEPWSEFFTSEKMIHPVTNRPEHKRSFIPSRWERIKVGQYVHAIKMGWMKPSWEKEKKKEDDSPNFYELWEKDDQSDLSKRYQHHIPAPKPALPGHAESYNPPPEYLFTEEEEAAWREKEPEERRIQFIPQSYSCLRRVPAYSRFINERFERCLDLYLCPRQRKMRMNVDPEDLIPKLPKPKDLQPFPTTQAIVYKGHENMVRCISVEPTGQWLVSGSDDQTIKFWEVSTGRCIKTLKVKGVVKSLAWNPNASLCLLAAAIGEEVLIINPQLGDKLVISNTDNMLASYEPKEEEESSSAKKLPVKWSECKGKEHDDGLRVRVAHPKELSQVTWHSRGDYLAVVMPKGDSMSVLIHQLSKRRSQNPFTKSKGLVQCVLFHPTRPFLFMATQRHVRVYNLLKQELSKKLMTNVKWVSSMAVHPGGDNLIIGSYDCRLGWFDLDLSTKPYKMLRHHKKAIRQVCYHKRYPLFASASDDGTIIVCHGMVYNDLLQNPLIVPVKVLRGHQASKSLGVLDCEFHPTQPWIFSSASDNTIRLFT